MGLSTTIAIVVAALLLAAAGTPAAAETRVGRSSRPGDQTVTMRVERRSYGSCAGGARVELYVVRGGGEATGSLDATALIVGLFLS